MEIGKCVTPPRARSQELRKEKSLTTAGDTCIPHESRKSVSLERGLPAGPASQTGTPAFGEPTSTPLPLTTPRGNATLRDRWTQGQQRGCGHLPLSTWPAAADSSGFAQRGGGPGTVSSDKKPWPRRQAARPRGRRTHRTKPGADRVGRQGRGERATPALHRGPGLETGGAELLIGRWAFEGLI